jgi:ABC-type transport system involved in multi-copper enzyme maturation permease subunit
MIAGIGSVLRYELITTSRRRRYFIIRLVYGIVLLGLLAIRYLAWERTHPDGGTVEEIRWFAEAAFLDFSLVQGSALLCLVPALVAGVIADEHQRKTLHYLLTSRLSSAEVILGKLGARLVHLGVFVAMGIPVVCLMGLYGGLNPENVAIAYGSAATLVWFIACLSMVVSTLAQRPRDAILAAYGLVFLWLVVPPFLHPFARNLGWLYGWVGPVNDVLLWSSPVPLWSWMRDVLYYSWRWRGSSLLMGLGQEYLVWMMGLQAVFGLLSLALAIMGLRPLRGNSWSGNQPRQGRFRRLHERLNRLAQARCLNCVTQNHLLVPSSRPPCGENPMLWKERYTSLSGGLRWLGSRPVVIVLGTLLACILFEPIWSLLRMRIDGRAIHEATRLSLIRDLSTATYLLTPLAMVVIAAAAGVSITSERDYDTWTSLNTTLLSSEEIVRAKQFGALWSSRWVGLALLVLWSIGVLLGVFHPLSGLLAIAIAGLGARLIAALGVLISVYAANSTRSLIITLLVVMGLGVWWLPGFLCSLLEWSGSSHGDFRDQDYTLGFYALILLTASLVLMTYGCTWLTTHRLVKERS